LANTRPITLAVIIGAHGVIGEVRLKLFAQGEESVKAHKSFSDGRLTLKRLR
jgi:16S rRNA processing protein RimM